MIFQLFVIDILC